MPAGFVVQAPDVRRLIAELKRTDKDLFNQMRREFRSEIRPYARELAANIPGKSPLSGFSRYPRQSRSLQTAQDRSPYVWKKPSASIDIGTGRRRRRSEQSLVRITFNDRRPYSALSIMETARDAQNWRGKNMLRGLETAGVGTYKKGRWVVGQFYDKRGEMVSIARRILQKYSIYVNRRFERRF